MFDFKYHIVSLVAVFLALGIGVVMGSMTAERGVVNDQEKALIATMEKDFENLRTENRELSVELSAENKFAEFAAPLLVTDKLKSKNIAIIITGTLDSPDLKELKAGLESAGAIVSSVTTFTGGTGQDTKDAPKVIDEVARWIGNGANARGIADLAATGFMKVSGTYETPVQGVVVVGGTNNGKAPKFDAIEAVIVKGIQSQTLIIAGSESSIVKNSVMAQFQDLGLSTVDNIDTNAGRISLIYVLSGQPGNYGSKATADSLMPVPLKS